jgi:hypothetical protein
MSVFWRAALPVIAVGSVAFLLWRVRRSTALSGAPLVATVRAEPATRAQNTPWAGFQGASAACIAESSPEREPPEAAARNLARPRAVAVLPTLPPFSKSFAVASPWVNQAALAIHLGRPGELRRLAGEMERAGQDVEAGLLRNYAVLLERSTMSRKLVLAEVTRMLEAAAAARKLDAGESSSLSRTPPADVDPPIFPIPVLSVGNGRGGSNK